MSIESAVGFGVLRNNKPCGIWPIPLSVAGENVVRMQDEDRKEHRGPHRYVIVPVFIGMPVTYTPPPVENPAVLA